MKLTLRYWLPALSLSFAILAIGAFAAFVLAVTISAVAHAAPLACVESLEHCAPTYDERPVYVLAQADASPAASLEPVSTSTPVAVPTSASGFVEDGTAAVKALAAKDYLYASGLLLFVLIGLYELFGTNVVPAKDRILVTLLLPALVAGAGALCLHLSLLAAGKAAGAALASAFAAEGGVATVLPLLKAALGIGAAPKPAA